MAASRVAHGRWAPGPRVCPISARWMSREQSGASFFGALDMAGNIYEWVEDCNHSSYDNAPADGSPWIQDCSNDQSRVHRGGSFATHWGGYLRVSLHGGNTMYAESPILGARCARSYDTANPCQDLDGDGFDNCEVGYPGSDRQPADCDERRREVYPNAVERCDGLDNNCDGQFDEGFDDTDADGHADCVDCGEPDPDIYVGAPEICDGKDNDCDDQTDEPDGLPDGYCLTRGVCAGAEPSCDVESGAWVCDYPETYEAEEETCDALDNDCDGERDEDDVCVDCRIVENINNTGLDIEMCTIVPAGGSATFWMGCREDLNGDEWSCYEGGRGLPQHPVTFDYGFEMMRSEVTVEMFRACVEVEHPGCVVATTCDAGSPNYDEAGSGQRPIVCVSWDMARAFAEWIGARLPSESEWEYAARGPMESADDYAVFPWGTDAIDCDHAAYDACEGDELDVCSQSLTGDSPFGLCDVAGNVWEWVQDCWHDDYDAAGGAPADGSAWEDDCSGFRRVNRGGSWYASARDLRAALRYTFDPGYRNNGLGARCARSF